MTEDPRGAALQDMIERMEPDTAIDGMPSSRASMAISLVRIANSLEILTEILQPLWEEIQKEIQRDRDAEAAQDAHAAELAKDYYRGNT